jgi:hypothetical protein|tara:strand:- start:4118 stop:4576 length:459 start_codon:yes stop_codon:yes gene_type:complete
VTTYLEVTNELVQALEIALPEWVVDCVEKVSVAWEGQTSPELLAEAEQAAKKCYDEVMPDLRALLLTDIDNQFVSPLSVIRKAVSFPTKVLRNNNVPEVIRDEFAIRNFPTDVYDLSPASFGDLNAELQELGIAWGAAKAHTHLQRRKQGSL